MDWWVEAKSEMSSGGEMVGEFFEHIFARRVIA